MSGIGEESLVLSLISSIISIIETTKQVYDAIEDESGLPKNFKKSATKLPLISQLFEDTERYINKATDESIKATFTPTLKNCKVQAMQLQELFEKVMPNGSESRWDRYVKAARIIGKKGCVESLVGGILDDLQLLATRFPQVITSRGKEKLENAIEEVAKMEPSLPDGFEQMPAYAHYGSGAQNNNTGDGIQNNNNGAGNQNNGPGQQFIGTNHISTPSNSRLKENKDKLLCQSIDWILQDPQYISCKCRGDVSLLWIKGGAGKDESTVVTYFFCQNADYELNTLQAIIKGLILQLVDQQKELIEYLRDHWDTRKERFNKDMTSWRTLWEIFYKMLYRCKCPKIYLIINALNECQDDSMADLLKLIVRTGLDRPSKIEWLLTIRPLHSAEWELLVGFEQVMINLKLNSTHISKGVTSYVVNKVAALDHRNAYGPDLCQKIKNGLTEKAEDTCMWVSLVCKELESVPRDKALNKTQDFPPGLHLFYHRALDQLRKGEPDIVKGCMRLLRVMMLVYRPLNVMEVDGVLGLSNFVTSGALVDRCASFSKMRGTDIEFVHQSARDYLVGENGKCILDTSELYGHHEIVVSCLSYLSQKLKVNLVDLPRPDSTWSSMEQNELLRSLDYSATFWAQHLEGARWEIPMQSAPIEQRVIHTFLCSKFLEWLECLSFLDKLERAADALKILQNIADLEDNVSLSMLVQGAKYFLFQDYETIEVLPLEIYNSVLVFSPNTSIIRKKKLDKLPVWLRKLAQVEDSIKLWDIAEALKVSRIFGNRVGRHIDFRKWQEIETLKVSRIFGNRVVHHIDFRKLQEIETSEEVKFLGFSTDGRHFITDLGLIKIENTINTQSPDYQSLQPLSIRRGWILYGEMPIVHLPFYFEVCCYNTMGDQMAICLINGKVLIFDINRASLDSILKGSV
ncbi:hypothetical protein ABEW05_002962 [Botrytis cinerea]